MLCVIPYYKGDRDLAQKLVAWIKELGDPPTLYLVRDAHAEPIDTLGLDVRKEIVVTESWNSWPKSPNWMISQVGRDILSEPWLWCEPDCVPFAKGWWQALQGEWERARAAGKWFVGDRVDVENVPVHMSGCAIYPPNVIEHAGIMLIAHDIAFDVEAANMILPKMYETKLIAHCWKHEPINNLGELNNLRGQHPEMQLFHADKAHSIIPMLRAELSGGTTVAEASEGGVWTTTVPPVPPTQLTCDIFIKSYPPDYPWLEYCLRSINCFASGFRKTIIVHPEGKPPTSADIGYTYIGVGEQPDGYLWQMVIKLDADRYTDASHILYIDSDTIFTCPVTPEMYTNKWEGERPIGPDFAEPTKVLWMLTPYEKVTTPWQQVIEKFLKKPVRFEFMRRQPFLVPRWLLSELRAFCEREHGVTLDAYVLSQPHRAFSEFNALGAFAYEFFRDEFVWVNTEETPPEQWPVLTVLQSWSRGGLTDEIKKRYEEILDGETSVVPRIGDIGGEEVQGNGEEDAPTPQPEETSLPTLNFPVPVLAEPTADRDPASVQGSQPSEARESNKSTWVESQDSRPQDSRGGDTLPIRLSTKAAKWDRVEQLVLELKGYCDSPVATARVRKAVVGAKIFPHDTINWIQRRKWGKKLQRKRKANRAS